MLKYLNHDITPHFNYLSSTTYVWSWMKQDLQMSEVYMKILRTSTNMVMYNTTLDFRRV